MHSIKHVLVLLINVLFFCHVAHAQNKTLEEFKKNYDEKIKQYQLNQDIAYKQFETAVKLKWDEYNLN